MNKSLLLCAAVISFLPTGCDINKNKEEIKAGEAYYTSWPMVNSLLLGNIYKIIHLLNSDSREDRELGAEKLLFYLTDKEPLIEINDGGMTYDMSSELGLWISRIKLGSDSEQGKYIYLSLCHHLLIMHRNKEKDEAVVKILQYITDSGFIPSDDHASTLKQWFDFVASIITKDQYHK